MFRRSKINSVERENMVERILEMNSVLLNSRLTDALSISILKWRILIIVKESYVSYVRRVADAAPLRALFKIMHSLVPGDIMFAR